MNLPEEALQRFEESMAGAVDAGEAEPTAMCLATRGDDGGVSARMVLLKEHDARGFVFYTNTLSNKGRQLAAEPVAALVFHWKATEQQVRVEGKVEPVSDAEADAYFASRDRRSQLGAWASKQSEPLANRALLVGRVVEVEARYVGRDVPRPPHWSGYRVRPTMIEFWYGKAHRLHDRFRFTLRDGDWVRERLYP